MKNLSNTSFHSSSGYTLVELLIAMLIGLFLIGGVYQVTAINKKTSLINKTQQQTQKDGRFAINHLSHAIKLAKYSGFYSDLSTGVENVLNNPGDEKWNISQPVRGFNNVSNTDSIAGVTGFVSGTDVLLLKGMNTNAVSVISSNVTNTTLTISANSGFVAGDIVVITDTDQASLFQIETVVNDAVTSTSTLTLVVGGANPGNASLLSNGYNASAEIGKYNLQMYYIKNGQNGFPALYEAILITNAGQIEVQERELVSNIDNLQIKYGVDTDNNEILDVYNNATAVVDWNQLVSMKLALITCSNEAVVNEKNSFTFDDDRVTFIRDATPSSSADKCLRRVFTTYIPLRN